VGRTTDGGSAWNFITVPGDDRAELRDIEAWDENTAIVLSVKSPARILKTSDGGSTWKVTYESRIQDVFLDGMAWWDRNRGIAYGDPVNGRFYILLTTDGGESWQELPEDQRPVAAGGEAGFAASGTGICTGKGGWTWFGTGGTESNVFSSGDYGRTWRRDPLPGMGGTSSRGINSVAFDGDRTGIVVGGDFMAPDNTEHIYSWTTDGGKTWITPAHDLRHPAGYRSCVEYLSGTSLVATGKNGTDISHDGGKNWTAIDKTEFNVVAKAKKGKWILLAGPGRIGRLQMK